mmetsp:Transcript_19622/g.29245  ORF Transcript_19622/g.29245 Transcript_19622/m.29245 type:complete len:120 (-) Transcript_19622:323-682(-)
MNSKPAGDLRSATVATRIRLPPPLLIFEPSTPNSSPPYQKKAALIFYRSLDTTDDNNNDDDAALQCRYFFCNHDAVTTLQSIGIYQTYSVITSTNPSSKFTTLRLHYNKHIIRSIHRCT